MGKDEAKQQPSLESVNRQLEQLKKSRQSDASKSLTPAASAARGAIDFASACAVGCLLGYGVDHFFGTAPWGIIAGSVIGTITGFKLMWQAVMKDVDKDKKN